MEIRDLRPESDAEAVTALVREAFPLVVTTPASWLHRHRTLPPRAEIRGWVAEVDGAVAGAAWAFRSFWHEGSTTALCTVLVHGPQRRGGIGAALFERVDAHVASLGSDTLLASFEETDEGVAFARRRGFAPARAEQHAVLDLAAIDPPLPGDADIRPLTDENLHDAHLVDMEATADMPASEPIDAISYEEWLEELIELPTFSRAGSFVAYSDGEPAAVSLLAVAGDRSLNMFTGTRRAFRGRGLGIAVKLASIRWAKEQGIALMATRNDETNAPMLAINRKLGFVPAGRQVEYVRAGTASSPAPPAPAT